MPHTSRYPSNIWDSLTQPALLDQAWDRVRSNGGCSGGDGVTIAAYQPRAAKRLLGLAHDLNSGTYRPSALRTVDIPKKKGGFRRLLIPSIQDRIVHCALALVLSPILDAQFEDASFAYRPGRSVRQAVDAIEKWRDAGYWHVIEADIVGFFDAIDHDLLLGKLEVALSGRDGATEIVALVAHWLAHLGQETGVPGKGVAQGSPLSPLLANLYLDALDETIEGKGIRLVRFADDFVILAKKRKTAEAALQDVREILGAHGLALHADETRIVDFSRGFEFLGHLFVRSMVLQQVSDPEEDLIAVLRDVADQDSEAAQKADALKKEADSGYDRGARVLYVVEPGRRLGLRNLSYAVFDGETELVAISHERVDRIEIGSGVSLDPSVIPLALGSSTDLVFVTRQGQIDGRLERPHTERAGLQMAQARACEDEAHRMRLAGALVEARIRNQRTQLYRLNRRQDNKEVTAAFARMGRHLRKLPAAKSVETLRGIEGAVAAEYWPALGLLCDGAACPFRRSRPAKDPLNAAINYLTALLERDIYAALQSAGLHTGFGLLHAARDYSDAAVYDLMEPFRAPLTEGVAVFLFNARRLTAEMFEPGAETTRILQPGIKAIISGYESAISRRINAPGQSVKLAWRPLMRRQALDLAACFRDPEQDFQAYLMEA